MSLAAGPDPLKGATGPLAVKGEGKEMVGHRKGDKGKDVKG